MKWTDRQLDALDREGQISALRYAYNCASKLEGSRQKINGINQQINTVNKTAQDMQSGLNRTQKTAVTVLLFLVFCVMLSFGKALITVIVLCGVYTVVDKRKLAPARAQRAEQYLQANYPPLASAKQAAEAEYAAVYNSDEGYNARLLLPDEYLSTGRIQSLIDILNRRRARSISEAMTICENMEHQQRIENMEREKLKAAQESAEAQRRAAAAAERTERQTRDMAREQKRMAQEQQRQVQEAARDAAREAASRQSTQATPSMKNTKTCFSCHMQIPKKAERCPYCQQYQLRGPMETLLNLHPKDPREEQNKWW